MINMNELTIKNELANVVTLVKHDHINGGEQYVFDCGNGFGASVVRHMWSYGSGKGKWELAVIEFSDSKDLAKFSLHYDNDIVDGDVLGYLDESEVMNILEKIVNIQKYMWD